MSYEYDRYLTQHKANVKKGFDCLREWLPDLVSEVPNLEWQINFAHDQSKSEPDEYAAYDAYFYGGNRSYNVVQEFRKAWLLHIHRNPHHWQHWVLINDDPKEGEIVLEMPYNYILEMICDWWAFSWADGNLMEIFEWYSKHKDYMKLHPKTRETVEKILGQIGDMLAVRNGESELAHHGVQGQKWGVRNGPPYPLDKSAKRDTIVAEAIVSGEVSKKVNREKQLRHTKDEHLPGRSYLDGDLDYAQELIDRLGGTGRPIRDRNGNWTHRERIEDSQTIGIHVEQKTGEAIGTKKGIIVYSKTGSHVYPAKEERRK